MQVCEQTQLTLAKHRTQLVGAEDYLTSSKGLPDHRHQLECFIEQRPPTSGSQTGS